jgi:hypothetical protein
VAQLSDHEKSCTLMLYGDSPQSRRTLQQVGGLPLNTNGAADLRVLAHACAPSPTSARLTCTPHQRSGSRC